MRQTSSGMRPGNMHRWGALRQRHMNIVNLFVQNLMNRLMKIAVGRHIVSNSAGIRRVRSVDHRVGCGWRQQTYCGLQDGGSDLERNLVTSMTWPAERNLLNGIHFASREGVAAIRDLRDSPFTKKQRRWSPCPKMTI